MTEPTDQSLHDINKKKANKNFSVETVNEESILEFKRWWLEFFKKICLPESSMGKIPKELKINFAPSKFMAFKYDLNNPGMVATEVFIDGMTQEMFHLIHPYRKQPILPTELCYLGEKMPINAKKKT
ncbi:hypothetical protein ANN_22665 [Periplaneta americana]|uniref:Per a allergen n=1 Tax=Periplaneta americana TaxID=6978 RepID=A0ABQ8S8R7_PERAM|nr:hypothetical protein ANN_22665 [Periplaneta americana]